MTEEDCKKSHQKVSGLEEKQEVARRARVTEGQAMPGFGVATWLCVCLCRAEFTI